MSYVPLVAGQGFTQQMLADLAACEASLIALRMLADELRSVVEHIGVSESESDTIDDEYDVWAID